VRKFLILGMQTKKKAIVLVNVGTPDKAEVKYVRRYLSQFLNDLRVIDLPWLLQKFLVNGVIVPFRARKSTQLYKRLWTDKGSPLLVNLNALVIKLQGAVDTQYTVFGAMRYGNPALKKVLSDIRGQNFHSITVFPLFPHYASSTTGSVSEFVMKTIKNWEIIPEVRFVDQFYNHPAFVSAFVNNIKSYRPENYDHVIFSYHGLPMRQINKLHPAIDGNTCSCIHEMPAHGHYCYKATCYHTTRLLASGLGLKNGSYTTSFQSRLSNNWLTPFTDKTLQALAQKGVKKVLIAAPAFVADCLETTIELGFEYKEMFLEMGGEQLTMVESLNDRDDWVKAVSEIVKG
jgi:protoporphyrin/coproporphyrin ferrochelatase